jgi:hypothetical protein
MLPNILCSCICNHIVLWLVNGWKIPAVTNDMQLSVWLDMPCEIFCDWLSFAIKSVIIYFQISSNDAS